MASHLLRPIAMSALVLGLAACSGTESSDPPDPKAHPTITASITPARTSTYSERQQARFEADGADGMVAAAGALWMKTDVGHVLRIDPEGNRITADVAVDQRTGQSFYCQGIGAVAGAIWACATRSDGVGVARIDPGSARITREHLAGRTEFLMIADTREQTAALNGAIRDRLVAAGQVDSRVAITNGLGERIGVGDRVATRHNDRDLGVANRETWTVSAVSDVHAVLQGHRGEVRSVPLAYADKHLELAYATTVYGAQGETTSAGHLVLGEQTSAASAYVGMTCGRTARAGWRGR